MIVPPVRPLEDRVLVLPFDADAVTLGGIILPDIAKEKSQQGEVWAAGPGKMVADGSRAKLGVEPGDVVVFSKYAGTEMKVAGKRCLLMRESEILAVIE